jgi:hypothetical protein
MSVMFGMRQPKTDTEFLEKFWQLTQDSIDITSPTRNPPVDLVPIFKYVPERFARWKTTCRRMRKTAQELFLPLIQKVEDSVAKGENTGAFMEEVIERSKEWNLEKENQM